MSPLPTSTAIALCMQWCIAHAQQENKAALHIASVCGRWVDFSLYGHQIVAHKVDGYNAAASINAVDGDPVPVPHYGLALSVTQFHELAGRVRDAGVHFEIQPHVRFEGQPGEQWTMFFRDASGNCLEFKAMTTPENLFAKYTVT